MKELPVWDAKNQFNMKITVLSGDRWNTWGWYFEFMCENILAKDSFEIPGKISSVCFDGFNEIIMILSTFWVSDYSQSSNEWILGSGKAITDYGVTYFIVNLHGK